MSGPPTPPEFVVTVSAAAGGTVVAAAGEIDLVTTAELGDAVRRSMAEGPVVLDLSEVSFIDSSGIRLLDALIREADQEKRTVRVHPVLQRPVRQVLDMTGMINEIPFQEGAGEEQP